MCVVIPLLTGLAACAPSGLALTEAQDPREVAALSSEPPSTQTGSRDDIDALISYYSDFYDVPEPLVRHVVNRESTYNPSATNGPHIGLMQIHPTTARTMGHVGEKADLYDPATNLKYGIKYLKGAYMVSGGDFHQADRLYQSGYYYHAKRMGLLEATGLR